MVLQVDHLVRSPLICIDQYSNILDHLDNLPTTHYCVFGAPMRLKRGNSMPIIQVYVSAPVYDRLKGFAERLKTTLGKHCASILRDSAGAPDVEDRDLSSDVVSILFSRGNVNGLTEPEMMEYLNASETDVRLATNKLLKEKRIGLHTFRNAGQRAFKLIDAKRVVDAAEKEQRAARAAIRASAVARRTRAPGTSDGPVRDCAYSEPSAHCADAAWHVGAQAYLCPAHLDRAADFMDEPTRPAAPSDAIPPAAHQAIAASALARRTEPLPETPGALAVGPCAYGRADHPCEGVFFPEVQVFLCDEHADRVGDFQE